MDKVKVASAATVDQILGKIDALIASKEDFDLDEYVESWGDANNYYSTRFINQIIDRRRKPTLAQARSILNTVENAIDLHDEP